MSRKKKRSAKALLAERRLQDAIEAERIRELARDPATTPETGKWKRQAEQARAALAKAAGHPAKPSKKSWKLGRSPSSGGNW